MHQYKCDDCGQPATIHETAIESREAIVSRHHCEEHGANVLHGAARSTTRHAIRVCNCYVRDNPTTSPRFWRRWSFSTTSVRTFPTRKMMEVSNGK